MATSKKTHTTKKVSASKKTAVKKSASVPKARPVTWRFYAVAIGIFLIAVTSVIVSAYFLNSVSVGNANKTRLDRIENIYSSLSIGDAYTQTFSNVFGDKRLYSWDKGRTLSSEVEYIHSDTVSNTVADLDAKIKAAGFEFVDEPYPGSTSVQYHYKSAKGEYVRLSVSSKPYNDAWYNAYAMEDEVPDSVSAMDKNAGPSEVTIKVNLDDNNE
jgi:hypothetical protein